MIRELWERKGTLGREDEEEANEYEDESHAERELFNCIIISDCLRTY